MRKNAIRFMLNDYPDVMSIDEMCRALSIGKKTGYKLLQTGQIRFLKIGRAYRIPKINLLEYLQVIRPNETGLSYLRLCFLHCWVTGDTIRRPTAEILWPPICVKGGLTW